MYRNLLKRNLSTLKIYRNNNNKAYIDTFKIDHNNSGPMVLDALFYVKNNLDKTLSFRRHHAGHFSILYLTTPIKSSGLSSKYGLYLP